MPDASRSGRKAVIAIILIATLFAAIVGARTSGPGTCTAPPRVSGGPPAAPAIIPP
ncbi:MAG: hypothetical protein ACUVSM_01280 [Armatimonadota bacterium]